MESMRKNSLKRIVGTVGTILIVGIFWTMSFAGMSAKDMSNQALQECHEGRSGTVHAVRLAHYQRARTLAEQAIALDDGIADGHFALFCAIGEKMRLDGEVLSSIFEFRRMMTALDRTLELNPNHLDALSSKGTILVKLPRLLGGDSEKGEQMLRQVIQRDPKAINARLVLAKTYADRGSIQEALDYALQALRLAQDQHRRDLIPEAQATVSDLRSSYPTSH